MARDDPHFRLRIPEDLKRRVTEAADSNKRSINAEIIARLEHSFVGMTLDGASLIDSAVAAAHATGRNEDDVIEILAEKIVARLAEKYPSPEIGATRSDKKPT